MELMKPGAIVGAGLLTVIDIMKLKTPQRGSDFPLYLGTDELKEATLISDPNLKRIIDIIANVISKESSHLFVGRRSGPSYFSEKTDFDTLSGGDIEIISSNFDGKNFEANSLEFIPSKVDNFLKHKTTPVFVTCGTQAQRVAISEKLNSMFAPCPEILFEPLFPGREAYFIVEKIFEINKPLLTCGFSEPDQDEVSSFLVIACGRSTIHWIVYDDYKHFVAMTKAKSVTPWAYKYICMNYDATSEDDHIQIALNTQEAIWAWKALRSA